jgi:hypothetical protein
VGWIILGLSAAVGVGTHLWGKYTQSVYSGAKIHEELAEGADQAGKSASDATGAIEDEADALKKPEKLPTRICSHLMKCILCKKICPVRQGIWQTAWG